MSSRRSFLRLAFDRLVDEATKRARRKLSPTMYQRPPGALPELAFLAACTRCGACMDVCPPKALVPAPPSAGLAAHTPIIDALKQPCTVCDTIPCIESCPTTALTMPAGGWSDIKMGWIELVPERCIVFQDVSCGVCARACPVGEEALKLDSRGAPVILQEGCVGCGVCVRACVTAPSSLIIHPSEAL